MFERISRTTIIILASCLLAVSYNMFQLPNKILSGGVTGVGMIISLLADLDAGVIIFLLNVPIFVLGFFTLGHRFLIRSGISVATTSIAMQFIPLQSVTDDPTLASIFGGVLIGISVGVIMRAGGSTGGFDIIGMVLARKREFPLGQLLFVMNAVVVSIAGFVFTWEQALYTLITMFASSKVIDAVHTRHVKLTLLIVTTEGERIKKRLVNEFYRGVTVLDGQGAYTGKQRQVLINVITRLELEDVKRLIREEDPKAFVNILETVEIMGRVYRNPDPLPRPASKGNGSAPPDDELLAAG
jgi:uncharacterized membrane-anchored protein YitT (DUF2179 family)